MRIRPHPQLIYSLKRILRLTGHADRTDCNVFPSERDCQIAEAILQLFFCLLPFRAPPLTFCPSFLLVTRGALSSPCLLSDFLSLCPERCYYLSSHCIRPSSCDFITLPPATWEMICPLPLFASDLAAAAAKRWYTICISFGNAAAGRRDDWNSSLKIGRQHGESFCCGLR